MAITPQDAAAQQARRTLSQIAAGADNFGMLNRCRVGLVITRGDRCRHDNCITSADAVKVVTRQAEIAVERGESIKFSIFPVFSAIEIDSNNPATYA